EIGFDPTNRAFTTQRQLKGYNFAIAGASWEDTFCYLQYALQHTDVKRVVIGVHAGALPIANCAELSRELTGPGWDQLLLSTTALRASVSTILEQRTDAPSHTREGLYFYTRGDPAVEQHFREGMRSRLRAVPGCELGESPALAIPEVRESYSTNIDLSALPHLMRMARERGIEIHLVLYPSHVYGLELQVQCGQFIGTFEAMRQIAQLLESFPARSLMRAWESFGYNEITGEQVSGRMRYWQDPQHFNYEVGDIMLDEMFGDPNRRQTVSLGRELSTSGAIHRIRAFLSEREQFIRTHPWFYTQLRSLVPANRWRGSGQRSTSDG